ncbi:MAG: hypothetical protein ACREL9_12750 [Gemmatimonadales bacterium]
MRGVSPSGGLLALRAVGSAALVLLLWNPVVLRPAAHTAPPLVLLDASLSMSDHWGRALDTARALAQGGVVWRFGARVAAFDTLAPTDGASRLGPALEAAAARGGEVVVVTDGLLDDLPSLPADLVRRPRIVLLARPSLFDAFVATVDGPRRVGGTDTVRLRVSYGTAGTRGPGRGMRSATLTLSAGGRRLLSRRVSLPDSGVVTTELPFPASRLPLPGWNALEVRLEAAGDDEPRDDARLVALEASPQPAAVLLASPPDWESRFLARTLEDVARVPLKVFVQPEPESGRWRDGTTLAAVPPADVARAVEAARLVVLLGARDRLDRFRSPPSPPASGAAVLAWPAADGVPGDWYVQPPSTSPLSAAGLDGLAWDSLPPATSVAETPPVGAPVVALTARLARRGASRAAIVLHDSAGTREATILAHGLWRWQFRGGSSGVAYRMLIAALADWLLAEGAGSTEPAVPDSRVVPNGMPLAWRWSGGGSPRNLQVRLRGSIGEQVDTLRFDAGGRAEQRLPPGVYRYRLEGGREEGVVAVERYSDEWRPAVPRLSTQAGTPAGRSVAVGFRDRWWLYVLAIAALTAEWAWRRRQGLP